MATLKILGASSKGNGYILECEKQSLILDLGIEWNKIMEGLNYNIEKVAGCLVSHC